MKQRDKKKYFIKLISEEEMKLEKNRLTLVSLIDDNMINCLHLKSVSSKEDYKLFLTYNEMCEYEKRIQRLFYDLSSLSKIEFKHKDRELLHFVNIFTSLQDNYLEALYLLGYRPYEVDSLYDSAVEEINNNEYLDCIYDEYSDNDIEIRTTDKLPGYLASNDIWIKIIYSLEGFIKVMKEEL
jgi:hypothetical protein